LEEGERVDELISEDTAEFAYGYFEYVVLVVLFDIRLLYGCLDDMGKYLILCFGFESCELLFVCVEVEFALFEDEDIEGGTIL